MDEKELRNLPINDEFGQCMRKLRVVSIEIKQKRQDTRISGKTNRRV